MGVIPANQARGLFTNSLVTVYRQIPPVKNFLKRFFPAKTSNTRYLYWAIRREGEPVAADVLRGTEGNRNTFSIDTEKIIDPPYFNENFDITQTDLYYKAWSSPMIDDSIMTDWQAWVMEKMRSVTNKIERAYELQRANVLLNGTITMADGSVVDFKRRTSSKVDLGSGNYWDTDTVDPTAILQEGATFCRQYGKAFGANFNVILGEDAMKAFLNNTIVKERGRDFYMKLTDLQMPVQDSDGAAYHGRVSAGSYTFDLWTYPQRYDPTGSAVDGTASIPFITPNKIIIIPETPDFITGYAAVPMLPKGGTTGAMPFPTLGVGDYVPYDWMDQRNATWIAGVKSAGITLPTAIDQIFTGKVLADS